MASRRLPLRHELMLLIGVLVTVVVAAVVVVGGRITSESLRSEIRQNLAVTYQTFEAIEALTSDLLVNTASQIALDPSLQEMRLRDPATLKDQAQTYFEDMGMDLMILTDLEGRSSVRMVREDGLPLQLPDEPVDLPLVETVLTEGEAPPTFLAYRDSLYLAAAEPLVRGRYVDGCLVLGWKIGEATAREASRGASGVTALFLRSVPGGVRHIAGYSTSQDNRPPPELVADLEKAQSVWSGDYEGPNPVTETVLHGTPYMALSYPLRDRTADDVVGWLVYLKPLEEAEARVEEMVWLLGLIGLAGLVVALVTSYAICRRTSRPIEVLSEQMRRVGSGRLDQEAEVAGSLEVARASEAFNEMVTGLRHKRQLEKFVPLAAREKIASDRSGQARLEGRRVTATVLFSDLRGFTTLSEKLDPTEVVSLLDEYLDLQSRVILEHHGDINEYIGDAILAIFFDREDRSGAELAIDAALAMDQALADLKDKTTNPHVASLKQGIGLHTGPLVEGKIGPSMRHKWAVIGDTVNLAARIQDISRHGRHTCVFISQDTWDLAGRNFDCLPLGPQEFKGKSQPVPVWEVVRRRSNPEGLQPEDWFLEPAGSEPTAT